MPTETLVLVDGSYYLFRAYHALPPLSNAAGVPTGAIYGVINMLRKLRNDYSPAYFAVVLDAGGESFRNQLYAEYKANRPPPPPDLVVQIEPLKQVIRALGVPLLCIEGVEADDVIGTLASQSAAAGLKTIISSGDKDLAQLVNDRITMINTMNNQVLDARGVQEKYGVAPEQIVDYLTLIGDSIDNVPGVPMVGPKTAARWLKEYGTLDNLLAHANEIQGKAGENLRAALDQLKLSRVLVTLKRDVSLPIALRDLIPGPPDRRALQDLFTRLEFKGWLKEFDDAPAMPPRASGTMDRDYRIILDEKELERWLADLKRVALFAFDTETTSLNYIEAEIVGVSFAIETGRAAYVPLAHDYPGAPAQLDRAHVLDLLRPLLEDPGKAKLGHNLKYDMSVLANHDIALDGIRYDTMLESYVLDSVATRHDLDSLAEKYLNEKTIRFEEVAGKGAKQLTFNEVPVEIAGPYAAEDADFALRLHENLWPKLAAEAGLKRLFEEIEIPLIPVLSRMERNGVMIDVAMLAEQGRELEKQMQAIEIKAQRLAGQPFNIGSPKQIQEILYDKMNLPVTERTPTGQPSTSESVLEELAQSFELPRLILEHRALAKLKSTYTDKLPRQISARTGRVHTSYHQAVAATGRLSSSDPNLQNIPVRTPEGRRIRQAFIAPDGYRLLAADYSQIELRIMAHLSGDEGLRRAFAQGLDIHRHTAAEVFELQPEAVSADQRRAAKAINFGLIYGMSPYGLARQLGIERRAAQEYVDRYFRRYPGVKRFMEEVRARAREVGYVETVFGRRLYLPEIRSRNAARRQYAERTAINAPMQGTAADIIKGAMIAIDRRIRERRIDAKMIMQVHDELVFEVQAWQVDEFAVEARHIMAGAAELSVPLVVDIGHGRNWDEAH
jgi:DNA polymerase-1